MLPHGDFTPHSFELPASIAGERIKKVARYFLYPALNFIISWIIKLLMFFLPHYAVKPNLWLLGQRGNDYERHRRRVNKFYNLNGTTILVAGCGTARDVISWLSYKPAKIIGIDYFSYKRAWEIWRAKYEFLGYKTEVSFEQQDLEHLDSFQPSSVDVISSDAVFEHIKNLPIVLGEFSRILKPGGLLYASFGPLWYGYGGDHISGYDNIESGYSHLLMSKADYLSYLSRLGEFERNEHDGRTWVESDLFSKLLPIEYIDALESAGFERVFVSAMIDPLALRALLDKALRNALVTKFPNVSIFDFAISAMTIIYRQK